MTQTDYPRYFFKCNVCDANDHGTPLYDYEVVDCPSCGTTNLTKWEAKPNQSRGWSHCSAFGHQWAPRPGKPTVEDCPCCLDTRDLTPNSARIR